MGGAIRGETGDSHVDRKQGGAQIEYPDDDPEIHRIFEAELARARGVRLHTHMAETVEEEAYCLELYGMRPVEYLEDTGWLGDDVWLAHCVHLNDAEVARFGETGTGVAHCPSSNARLGAGIAPVAGLLRAGSPVGLGVDGYVLALRWLAANA